MTQSPSRRPEGAKSNIGKSDDGWEVLDDNDDKDRVEPPSEIIKELKEDSEGSVAGDERDEGWEEARREA